MAEHYREPGLIRNITMQAARCCKVSPIPSDEVYSRGGRVGDALCHIGGISGRLGVDKAAAAVSSGPTMNLAGFVPRVPAGDRCAKAVFEDNGIKLDVIARARRTKNAALPPRFPGRSRATAPNRLSARLRGSPTPWRCLTVHRPRQVIRFFMKECEIPRQWRFCPIPPLERII
jgi:hypothetical protein